MREINVVSLISVLFAFFLSSCSGSTFLADKVDVTSIDGSTDFRCTNGRGEETTVSEVERLSGVKKRDWLEENLNAHKEYINEFTVESSDVVEVAESDIYFVQTNKVVPALDYLVKEDAHQLRNSRVAKAFAGRFYESTVGTEPYLVRAMYENFTGNDFKVFWHKKDKTLLVSYRSLGTSGEKYFSPLVINLVEEPERVVFKYTGSF